MRWDRIRIGAALAGAVVLLPAMAACTSGGGGSGSTTSAAPTPSSTSTSSPVPTSPSPGPTPTQTGGPSPSPTSSVISASTTHDWARPLQGSPFVTRHTPPVPPVPCLTEIGLGRHPEGSPPYEQLSFRFDHAFPAYDIQYVSSLHHEGSGAEVPLPGVRSILRVAFEHAQAHTDSGASCITSAPPQSTGEATITRYTRVDDFEGHLDYGVGIGISGGSGDAHPKVRVVEVQRIDGGKRVFVVAVQVDSTSWR